MWSEGKGPGPQDAVFALDQEKGRVSPGDGKKGEVGWRNRKFVWEREERRWPGITGAHVGGLAGGAALQGGPPVRMGERGVFSSPGPPPHSAGKLISYLHQRKLNCLVGPLCGVSAGEQRAG